MPAFSAMAGLHALNHPARTWPETNCYLDLWIGLLHAAGQDPLPLMGCAAGLRWEADHFTFVKPNAADLYTLAGVVLQEMALWDRMETQVAAQIAHGAVPMPEVDSFFLHDTADHRRQHGKTSIAIVGIDTAAQTLDYIHSGRMYRLDADDYCGVLGLAPHGTTLFPYTELARLPEHAPPPQHDAARTTLRRLARSRGPGNPVRDFAAALPGLLPGRADQVHALCFNTLRQLGAAFGLFANHLAWLGQDGSAAATLADQAKTAQFMLARATRRGRPDPAILAALDEMATTWEYAVQARHPPAAPATPPA